MRNNQLEQAMLRAGFTKIAEGKPKKPTQLHHVTESKPTWETLTRAEQQHYELKFNALS